MEFLIVALTIVWLLGFVATGFCYFVPRGIRPQDQHWIPELVAIVWPVGLPVYVVVQKLRAPKGSLQGEYWKKNHNPWLD